MSSAPKSFPGVLIGEVLTGILADRNHPDSPPQVIPPVVPHVHSTGHETLPARHFHSSISASPKSRISAEELRALRNEIPLHALLLNLGIPVKKREDFWRFLCPYCSDMNTAIHPGTNLGRCFRCKINFNTIDMVSLVRKTTFLDSIAFLRSLKPILKRQ